MAAYLNDPMTQYSSLQVFTQTNVGVEVPVVNIFKITIVLDVNRNTLLHGC